MSEKRLLRYPPTRGTWRCDGEWERMTIEPENIAPDARFEAKVICRTANAAGRETCWLCGTEKPEKAKLVWPEYLRALTKLGVKDVELFDKPIRWKVLLGEFPELRAPSK